MKPETQQIAIAEACGWTNIEPDGRHMPQYIYGTRGVKRERIPDYLNDLNAMHEAEATLAGDQQMQWFWHMEQVLKVPRTRLDAFTYAHATAAQRAEAFLKTIGKWQE